MNTVQITVRGKNYTLRTDENPERMAEIADSLNKRITEFADAMKGRADAEILTLVAFDLMEQSDDCLKEIEKIKKRIEEIESKNKDSIDSAESELYRIAEIKEQENSDLRTQLQEYEKLFEKQVADKNAQTDKEYEAKFESLKEENKKLSQENETLKNIEKSFNDYIKTKEREITAMQEEIEALKMKLAEVSDDGQMTL